MNALPYLLATLSTLLPLIGEEIVVLSPSGEPLVIEIDENDRFLDTVDMLRNYFNTDGQDYLVNFNHASPSNITRASQNIKMRNYYAKLTSKQQADMRYIMKILGTGSLIKIAKERSSLTEKGKSLEEIHPLTFALVIFIDEELKAYMHGLYGRTWVWSEFWDDWYNSFVTESGRDNMKPEFVYDFCSKLGISVDLIMPLVTNRQWNQLIKTLVDKIPRNSNAKRYEM